MKNILLSLIVAAVFFGCKKAAVKDTASPDDVFYFKGVINTISYDWTQAYHTGTDVQNLISFGTNRGIFADGGSFLQDCGDIYCKEISEGVNIYSKPSVNNALSNALLIRFTQAVKRFGDNDNDIAEIKTWFNPGMKSFAFNRRSSSAPVHDGILIDYADADSHGWGSSIEWGDQDGSSFESLELKDAAPDKPYLKTWKARFSCKLFQPNGCVPGAPTQIINISGEFYLPVFERNN